MPNSSAIVVAGLWAIASLASGADQVDFNRDIRPILANNCFTCHGPDEKKRQASLRLDRYEIAIADRDGTRAIVPGNPQASALVQRIASSDADERMPPAETGKKLTPQQIETLTRWIKQGAKYSPHWAYVKPIRPPVPPVANRAWPHNAVDSFILARLEHEGLGPSPEADRYVLVRRLSLDLTGLPPTIEEVDRFVGDKSPDAYEKVVDRLLASEAFGEHWARMWLDLARYADSAGYVSDVPRQIWAFRDYVIRAINANKPFDQFTIEQIAGDLLPDPTPEQIIATAFHRNTQTNNEGGSDREEYRNVAIVDRVNTTMAVWMGTTMACAQCHDHKYDPLTQKEYFQLFAILNNTEDADRADEKPVYSLATEAEPKKKAAVASVPIMRELPANKRRITTIQYRGNFLDRGPAVTAGVPALFPPLPKDLPPNRLALARWLIDENNPLTARVVVNHYWEKIFGIGLVATSDDFGTQGEMPSHPELLDWLATELVARHWDLKYLVKLLVTTAAYRQSSRLTPALLERDPDNRLLAHGPRFRLDAEAVRDQALFVSGLLSRKMYGPAVRPLQPSFGLSAAFGGAMDWQTSAGEDRYRRGVYIQWRRTNPYPSAVTFDAPSREVCTVRRSRSNTPLQALVTLNDPVYVEAAQALGRRIFLGVQASRLPKDADGTPAPQRRDAGETPAPQGAGKSTFSSSAEKIRYGWRLCLARPPCEAEVASVVRLHDQARDRFARQPEQARKMAGAALPPGADPIEPAAWAVVGNVLLNLDEMFMRL
jgi:cytochrome c553